MKLPVIAAAVALAAMFGFAFGFKSGGNAVLADQARWAARMEEVEERAIAAASKAIAQIKVQNKTIYNEVERETRIVPDYTACRHSDVGLRNVNAALLGEAGTDRGELSALDEAR